jgi:hypothetical protein
MKQFLISTSLFLLTISCAKEINNPVAEQQTTSAPPANEETPLPPQTNNCLTFREASVVSVTGPSQVSVNQEVAISVNFGVISGCGKFERFEESNPESDRNITVIARYEGCLCTLNAPVLKTTYQFKSATPGVYLLHFKKSNTQVITHQITVK